MSTMRININLSKLHPDIRANLSQLCVYLLGLKPSDKEAYFESVYAHFFKTKLYSAMKREFERNHRFKNFASNDVIKQIIEDLTQCIGAISDDEIIQTLKQQIALEAKANNARPQIECLKAYKEKARKCFTGTSALNASQKAWGKALGCLDGEVSYKESLKYLNWNGMYVGVGFFVVLMLFQKFIFDILSVRAPENTQLLEYVSERQSYQQIAFMTLVFICTILGVAAIPTKIKVNFDVFDDVITNRFEKVIKENLAKKSELEICIKLANPRDTVCDEKDKNSTVIAPAEEDRLAPKKEKRRWQISYSTEPSEEVKNEDIRPEISLNGSKYILNNHPSGRCYTRFNHEQIEEKISLDRKQILMPKITSAIELGRIDDPVRPGIVKVDENELKKFPFGWKLRIREDERLEFELRNPKDEENENGMEQVFSPRSMQVH